MITNKPKAKLDYIIWSLEVLNCSIVFTISNILRVFNYVRIVKKQNISLWEIILQRIVCVSLWLNQVLPLL